MDEYVALRDCYYEGHDLKKGDTFTVPKGTVVEFKLVEKISVEAPKKGKAFTDGAFAEEDEAVTKKTGSKK